MGAIGSENNWSYVAAAFIISWCVILGYTVHVHRVLARARKAYEDASASRPKGA
ncbi:MAG: hypothetical protein NTZ43_08955 [Gemmatimonadetes bacterium]|nr:hypothetical protein [Gemmatimonadota bacterium]